MSGISPPIAPSVAPVTNATGLCEANPPNTISPLAAPTAACVFPNIFLPLSIFS